MIGLLISIIAIFLFTLVYVLDNIYQMTIGAIRRKYFGYINETFMLRSKVLDIFSNWFYADFWNSLFSKHGYCFGRFSETMSSVFGKKWRDRSLSIPGYIIAGMINVIDFTSWHKGGHCFYAIQTDEEIHEFMNQF